MTEIPWRHAWWRDHTWEQVKRIVAAEPAWVKPACHPEMFGLDRRGVAMSAYLLERGCLPPGPRPEDEVIVTHVPLEGRTLRALYGRRPGLEEEVGRYPDRPSTWRALGLLDVTDHERTVTYEDESLVVRVFRPYRRSARTDLLDDLVLLVEGYREAIEDALDLPGGGYADLLSTFVETGLGVPHLPPELRDRLRLHGPWHWSSRPSPAAEGMSASMTCAGETVEFPVEDHVELRRGSESMPSIGMTLRLAYGPLAVYVEDSWYGGPEDNAHLTGVFARVTRLAQAAERRVTGLPDLPTGEWRRPVVVTCLDGELRCRLWDPVRGEPVDLPLTGDDRNRWAHIAERIDTCFVPAASDRVRP